MLERLRALERGSERQCMRGVRIVVGQRRPGTECLTTNDTNEGLKCIKDRILWSKIFNIFL